MRRLIPHLAALAGIALFTSLGLWQLDRADEKRALFQAFEQGGEAGGLSLAGDDGPGLRYRWVEGDGRYLDRQFLVDNITRDGRPGYFVLTPFRPQGGGELVLVNRGWVPGGPGRASLPEPPVPAGPVGVRGRLDRLPRPGLELGDTPERDGWPRLVVYPRMERLESALGEPLAGWTVLLSEDSRGGFRRDFQPATYGPERHLGYAVQWFALAVTVFVVWTVLSLRRRGRVEREGDRDDG